MMKRTDIRITHISDLPEEFFDDLDEFLAEYPVEFEAWKVHRWMGRRSEK